jgi:TrmH family RNA methyltransferase
VITSTRNKRVASAVRLKKRAMREKDRLFLVEGAQAVGEALSGAQVREIFVAASAQERHARLLARAAEVGVAVHSVSHEVMEHLTSTVAPQGLVAVSAFIDGSLDDLSQDARFVVVLHQVRDPGNAGTILRSADGAGADAVVFTRSSVDAYNEKTVRATAGSLFHVLLVRDVEAGQAVAFLRERGFSVLAADPAGRRSLYETDLTGPTAVLFGNEAGGLGEEALALADETVRVPITGRVESLNLAAAATVVLFEAARQRARRR